MHPPAEPFPRFVVRLGCSPVYNAEARSGVGAPSRAGLEDASEYEVLLVNDASRDRSWPAIRNCRAQPAYRGIDLMRNYDSKRAAVRNPKGALFSLVTLDDDLQNPPEEIPKLLLRLSGDAECVRMSGA